MTEKMIKRNLSYRLIPFSIFVVLSFVLDSNLLWTMMVGYFLSFVFVFSSTFLVWKFWNKGDELFIKVYFLSLPLRFVVVLTAFGLILWLTKIPQIYFTVSFIISYLFESVTELIFIHKTLQKRSHYT